MTGCRVCCGDMNQIRIFVFPGGLEAYGKHRAFLSKAQKMEGMKDYIVLRQHRPQVSTDFSFLKKAQVIVFHHTWLLPFWIRTFQQTFTALPRGIRDEESPGTRLKNKILQRANASFPPSSGLDPPRQPRPKIWALCSCEQGSLDTCVMRWPLTPSHGEEPSPTPGLLRDKI